MTALLALLIGALAAGLVTIVVAVGPGAPRHDAVRGLAAFAVLVPALWMWARSTGQFPATFGAFAFTQAGLLQGRVPERLRARRRTG
ncbi:hypothetical protein ACWF94_39775 [Streptomyces sp. NPDC055078]